MGVLEIENNYKKHKQRLMSIQHINSKKTPHVSAMGLTTAATNYRQSRNKAGNFAERTRNSRID